MCLSWNTATFWSTGKELSAPSSLIRAGSEAATGLMFARDRFQAPGNLAMCHVCPSFYFMSCSYHSYAFFNSQIHSASRNPLTRLLRYRSPTRGSIHLLRARLSGLLTSSYSRKATQRPSGARPTLIRTCTHAASSSTHTWILEITLYMYICFSSSAVLPG